jgi:hypothetical protein
VVLLAIRRGEGGMSAAEAAMLGLAGGGVIGWIVADQLIVAIACVIAADLVATALMAPKTYHDPGSETLVTYAGASLAGPLLPAPSARSTSRCCSTPSTTAW